MTESLNRIQFFKLKKIHSMMKIKVLELKKITNHEDMLNIITQYNKLQSKFWILYYILQHKIYNYT